ncbi:MAG TPA: hypothetical protein VHX60_15945 [Acidobacteriaceae bacterium]|jgi:hypothetical protein|nr:hypothetical protein [Acidobacteriaceae bacterium]
MSDEAKSGPPEDPSWTGGNEEAPRDIDVDLTRDSGYQIPVESIPSRESVARWVAQAILITYGAAVSLLIVLGFVVIIWLRWAPDKAQAIFTGALIPYVEKVGTFATTVFGPLLAFILGYYFGEKK